MEYSDYFVEELKMEVKEEEIESIKGVLSQKYNMYSLALRCLERMSVRFVPNSKV